MNRVPFYDPAKTYSENFDEGPFGDFADGAIEPIGEPRFDFLGEKLSYPFGIPSGPLLNGAYVEAAFANGFDVSVYKTVRGVEFPCHPFPNVLSVQVDGDLTLDKVKQPLVAHTSFDEPLSITNSFGVPSRSVDAWLKDAKKASHTARRGQTMIMSFMGTVQEGQSESDFAADFARVAERSLEVGARILEMNLSCPNLGNEGLVCYNLDITERVCAAVREKIGATPLVVKIGYVDNDVMLERLARIVAVYAHGISAINTISAVVVNEEGAQALPGKNRVRSGVCGSSIKWAGLEMTHRLAAIRTRLGVSFSIVGVGGVMNPSDFRAYRDAGADVVMSATGAMWNPCLAKEIKEAYPDG